MEWMIVAVAAGAMFLGYLCGWYGSRAHWKRDAYDDAYLDALDAYVSLSRITASTNVRVIDPSTYKAVERKIDAALESGMKP